MFEPKRYSDLQRREFNRLFGVDLKTYWDVFTGFDLIKFDEKVVKPKAGTSTRQAIKKEWGIQAVALIEDLIGFQEVVK